MLSEAPTTIDGYIAGFPAEVGEVLTRIRQTIRQAAPAAAEKISYRMPTFYARRVIIHFGAFKHHIGIFPPVREPALQDRVAPYRGPKGNLQFPLNQPIPYDLIADIVKARIKSSAGPGRR